jgi:hypothetical protein
VISFECLPHSVRVSDPLLVGQIEPRDVRCETQRSSGWRKQLNRTSVGDRPTSEDPSMSFFGRQCDRVAAFAIPDAVSEHAVSKMTDQARVRWPGRSRIGILLQPAAPMGISNLSCFLRTVERGECDADHTIEQSALGAYTGQDAHAHQNAKQMLRQAGCRSGRRNSPIGLTLFHAGQEE